MTKTSNEAVRQGLFDLCDALGLTEPSILWEALSPDGALMEAVKTMAELIRVGQAVKGGALTRDEGEDILAVLLKKKEGWAAGPDMGWNDETRRAKRIDFLGRYGLPTGADDTERAN